jgi:hypothetical protein
MPKNCHFLKQTHDAPSRPFLGSFWVQKVNHRNRKRFIVSKYCSFATSEEANCTPLPPGGESFVSVVSFFLSKTELSPGSSVLAFETLRIWIAPAHRIGNRRSILCRSPVSFFHARNNICHRFLKRGRFISIYESTRNSVSEHIMASAEIRFANYLRLLLE